MPSDRLRKRLQWKKKRWDCRTHLSPERSISHSVAANRDCSTGARVARLQQHQVAEQPAARWMCGSASSAEHCRGNGSSRNSLHYFNSNVNIPPRTERDYYETGSAEHKSTKHNILQLPPAQRYSENNYSSISEMNSDLIFQDPKKFSIESRPTNCKINDKRDNNTRKRTESIETYFSGRKFWPENNIKYALNKLNLQKETAGNQTVIESSNSPSSEEIITANEGESFDSESMAEEGEIISDNDHRRVWHNSYSPITTDRKSTNILSNEKEESNEIKLDGDYEEGEISEDDLNLQTLIGEPSYVQKNEIDNERGKGILSRGVELKGSRGVHRKRNIKIEPKKDAIQECSLKNLNSIYSNKNRKTYLFRSDHHKKKSSFSFSSYVPSPTSRSSCKRNLNAATSNLRRSMKRNLCSSNLDVGIVDKQRIIQPIRHYLMHKSNEKLPTRHPVSKPLKYLKSCQTFAKKLKTDKTASYTKNEKTNFHENVNVTNPQTNKEHFSNKDLHSNSNYITPIKSVHNANNQANCISVTTKPNSVESPLIIPEPTAHQSSDLLETQQNSLASLIERLRYSCSRNMYRSPIRERTPVLDEVGWYHNTSNDASDDEENNDLHVTSVVNVIDPVLKSPDCIIRLPPDLGIKTSESSSASTQSLVPQNCEKLVKIDGNSVLKSICALEADEESLITPHNQYSSSDKNATHTDNQIVSNLNRSAPCVSFKSDSQSLLATPLIANQLHNSPSQESKVSSSNLDHSMNITLPVKANIKRSSIKYKGSLSEPPALPFQFPSMDVDAEQISHSKIKESLKNLERSDQLLHSLSTLERAHQDNLRSEPICPINYEPTSTVQPNYTTLMNSTSTQTLSLVSTHPEPQRMSTSTATKNSEVTNFIDQLLTGLRENVAHMLYSAALAAVSVHQLKEQFQQQAQNILQLPPRSGRDIDSLDLNLSQTITEPPRANYNGVPQGNVLTPTIPTEETVEDLTPPSPASSDATDIFILDPL